MLLFLAGISSQCGGSATHVSISEDRNYSGKQGCHAFSFLAVIRQVSKQDGAAVGAETTGAWDILEEDYARRRAVPVQVVWYPQVLTSLKYMWEEEVTSCTYRVRMGRGFSSQQDWSIGKQRGSERHFLVS